MGVELYKRRRREIREKWENVTMEHKGRLVRTERTNKG
jgi:hypothetical protein